MQRLLPSLLPRGSLLRPAMPPLPLIPTRGPNLAQKVGVFATGSCAVPGLLAVTTKILQALRLQSSSVLFSQSASRRQHRDLFAILL